MSDAVNQGTPGCVCEHASLSRALMAARLPEVPAWTDGLAPREELPGVVLTWSSREDLLLSPRGAWLECPGVRVVRLPVGYLALQRLFAQSARPVRCPAAHTSRTHVTGQFRWALDEFGSRLVRALPEELTRRLRELERFANDHWPGWYAEVFCEVRRALGDGARNRAKALLDLAGEVADEVAALQPLSPLFHGFAYDVVNRGAGPARAAIGGVLSGTLTPAQGQAVLRRGRWWDGLVATLAACQQQLRDLAKADNETAIDVREQVAEMQDLLDRFSDFAREVCRDKSGSARQASGKWGAAQADLGRLMDLVGALSRRRAALRERMKEGQGLGQEVQD